METIIEKTLNSNGSGYIEYFNEIGRCLGSIKIITCLVRRYERNRHAKQQSFTRWQIWSLQLENYYYKSELSSIELSIQDVKFRENTVKTELGILQKKYESKLSELSLLLEKYILT